MRKLTDLRLGWSCRRPHDVGEYWRAVLRCSMPQPRLVRAPDRSIGSSVRCRGNAMTGLSLIGAIAESSKSLYEPSLRAASARAGLVPVR